mmetsp:Transcript_8327/g.14276  ORF Transcript_8327/g.14276 Transcript_8327/m.14276 type:complete len:221 (-) Transcript_8327:116-778(-)
MESKGVTRVHHPSAMVIAEHGVGPVQVGCHDELHLMALAQIDLVASLDLLALEGPVCQPLQEREADLAATHNGLRVAVQDVGDESRVIRLCVAHKDVVDLVDTCCLQLLIQCLQEKVVELLMAGIHQCGLLSKDEVGVVCGAILKPELNIKAVTVPVQRADADCIGRKLKDLCLQSLVLAPLHHLRHLTVCGGSIWSSHCLGQHSACSTFASLLRAECNP